MCLSFQGTADINKTVLTAVATDPDDGPGGSVLFSMAVRRPLYLCPSSVNAVPTFGFTSFCLSFFLLVLVAVITTILAAFVVVYGEDGAG